MEEEGSELSLGRRSACLMKKTRESIPGRRSCKNQGRTLVWGQGEGGGQHPVLFGRSRLRVLVDPEDGHRGLPTLPALGEASWFTCQLAGAEAHFRGVVRDTEGEAEAGRGWRRGRRVLLRCRPESGASERP